MMDRSVRQSTVKGWFGLPVGVDFLSRGVGNRPDHVVVSTVCLDGGHLEDPLGICEPETGYETMVFLDGCTFFSLYTEKYKTKREATNGHKRIVKQLLVNKLPLAISLNYVAREELLTAEAA